MAINKVIDRNGNTLIDLTNDTISPNKVLEGVQFHGPDGNIHTGTLPASELDTLKYNFIDYEGTLLYSLTDTEIDALTELPVGADHTDENLTFQGWNWTLEELKAWNRTRPDRPIVGAHYITTDGITYITLTTDPDSSKLTETITFNLVDAYGAKPSIRIHWGDDSQEEIAVSGNRTVNHTYPLTNTKYTIQIVPIENADNLGIGYGDASPGSGYRFQGYSVESVKLGLSGGISKNGKLQYSHIKKINIPINTKVRNIEFSSIKSITISKGSNLNGNNGGCFSSCYNLEYISLPPDITIIPQNTFSKCYALKYIVIPEGVITIGQSAFSELYSIRNIFLPSTLETIGNSAFYYSRSITSITIPDSVTSIGNSAFSDCYCLYEVYISKNISSLPSNAFSGCHSLRYITIPDNIQSIGSNCFNGILNLTLDLSQQTKVITLAGTILQSDLTRIKLLVPAGLLDQHKSATYWSGYASRMIGV